MTSNKAPLTAEDAATLLHLLATDQDFRAAFQADPATALQQVSDEAARAACDCKMPGELASPVVLQAAHQQLLATLTSEAIFSHPFCFIDGQTSAT